MIKCLNTLKSDIGQPQHSSLWHYAEILDVIVKYLESTERTGEWVGSGDGYDWNGELVYDTWECSKCGYTIDEDDTDLLPKYCQECGAKMGK